MNRIIKFRVWDTSNRNWIYPLSLVPGNVRDKELASDLMLCFLQGQNIRWGHSEVCTVRKEHYISAVAEIDITDCFVIQQFTGLLDKNGVEIYEGDIVNVNGGNHIIEWRGAGFAATWSDYNLDTCWFVGGGPVVVGNIFENPELAEKARKHPRA